MRGTPRPSNRDTAVRKTLPPWSRHGISIIPVYAASSHFQAAGSIRNLARLDTRSDDKRDRRKHQRKGKPKVGARSKRSGPLPASKRLARSQKERSQRGGNSAKHLLQRVEHGRAIGGQLRRKR